MRSRDRPLRAGLSFQTGRKAIAERPEGRRYRSPLARIRGREAENYSHAAPFVAKRRLDQTQSLVRAGGFSAVAGRSRARDLPTGLMLGDQPVLRGQRRRPSRAGSFEGTLPLGRVGGAQRLVFRVRLGTLACA